MTRRILVLVAVLALLATPATAQAPVPPAGTVLIVMGVSDGMTVLPTVALVCLPVEQ